MFRKIVSPKPKTAIEQAREIRKIEAKEHKYLDKRSVGAWNHSSQCRPCYRKSR